MTRKHNKKWADNTRALRQKKRRKALKEIAESIGYSSWSAVETALLNGDLIITASEK